MKPARVRGDVVREWILVDPDDGLADGYRHLGGLKPGAVDGDGRRLLMTVGDHLVTSFEISSRQLRQVSHERHQPPRLLF